ncbi:MAG: Rz1-like lysis system protein LysC [Alkalilacustris sp.]
MRMMMPGALLCLLAACTASAPADLAPPPPALLDPCALPTPLPHRDATQAEVEHWWGEDRSALRRCGARHALLVEWATGQLAARP